MREYSEAFKRKLVQRMLMPNGPSASKLSQEVGINQPTLSRWLREATTLAHVTKRRKRPTATNRPTVTNRSTEQKRPEDRTADEKLRLVLEAGGLAQADLGEFLRRHGLLSRFRSIRTLGFVQDWSSSVIGLRPRRPGFSLAATASLC